MITYYQKYRKYKNKYITLKNKMNILNNFYLVHFTTLKNLKNILKEGKIYPGKYLPKERWTLSGEPLENIYMLIYFKDLKNIKKIPAYAIIMDPKIILKKRMIFNKGWGGIGGKDIVIEPSDTASELEYKINEIKTYIENPSTLPPILQEVDIMTHQVKFDEPIELNNNIIAINCEKCDKSEDLDEIRKIIKNKSYDDIKIMI